MAMRCDATLTGCQRYAGPSGVPEDVSVSVPSPGHQWEARSDDECVRQPRFASPHADHLQVRVAASNTPFSHVAFGSHVLCHRLSLLLSLDVATVVLTLVDPVSDQHCASWPISVVPLSYAVPWVNSGSYPATVPAAPRFSMPFHTSYGVCC